MIRKMLSLAFVVLLAQTQLVAPALAASGKQAQSVGEVKTNIDRAGVGEKARVTVWRRDGTKIKGYVAERRETEFVLRDRKTDAPTIIPFADVTKVDVNRGHSTARNTAIGVAIGAGVVLTVLGVLIASLDD